MSFFKGEEAIAIVKVPEELYDTIMSLDQDIGKLIQEDAKFGRLIINGGDGLERRYKVNFPEADKKSILFEEKDSGDFKVHFQARFNGSCIPDDDDDLVRNLQEYIEENKKEYDLQEIRIAERIWEAQQRKPNDQSKPRQRKTEVWTEDKLKERLFVMFDENDTILYEELKEKTNAPKGPLDKCLKEIADFNRDSKSYKLKEQYRRNVAGSGPNKKVKTT